MSNEKENKETVSQKNNNKVVIVSTNKASDDRARFMEDRNITTYMKSEYRRTSPGRVGVSLFLEAEIDGQRFRGGKSKNVKSEYVPKLRESLDELGRNFTAMSLENATDNTFDDLINGVFSKVVTQEE